MILHIGDNNYIFKKDIIAILDRKSIDSMKISSNFINEIIKEDCLVGRLDSQIKSYILVSKENKTIIYTSSISSKALANRNN